MSAFAGYGGGIRQDVLYLYWFGGKGKTLNEYDRRGWHLLDTGKLRALMEGGHDYRQ